MIVLDTGTAINEYRGYGLEYIADALFTTTQGRVLSYIFGHPNRSFYIDLMIIHILLRDASGKAIRESLWHCGLFETSFLSRLCIVVGVWQCLQIHDDCVRQLNK